MWVYFFVFFLIAFVATKDLIKVDFLIDNVINLTLLVMVICFFGFRYYCDNDYDNYVLMYKGVPLLSGGITPVIGYSAIIGVESGYLLFNSLLKSLELGTQSIFIFCSFVTIGISYLVFKRNCIYPIISILVYYAQFFVLPFTQIRFGLAAAIVLLACFSLGKSQKLLYWFLIALSVTIHFCGIGGIVVFFFYRVNWLKRPVLLWSVLIVSLFFILLPMRSVLLTIMGSVGVDRYVKIYSDADSSSPFSTIASVIILIPLLYFRTDLIHRAINVRLLISMGLSSVFVGSLVWQLGILSRFSVITATSFCIILPSYLFLLKRRSDKLIGYILLVLYCLLKFMPNVNYLTAYQIFIGHSF